jgi:hypothetical protein
MPATGTVIPVHGHTSQTQATVTTVVPLQNWQVLWYEPPFGKSNVTDNTRFHITSYIADFDVPPTWVPIVQRNGDGIGPLYAWVDGRETAAWIGMSLSNGWVNYGNGYTSAEYKVENGLVHLRGMVRSGTSAGITTLPVGARPLATRLLINMTSPNAVSRLNVTSAGVVSAESYSNAWVSLETPPFPADQ